MNHRGHMERKSLYTYAAVFIVLSVLFIIAVADYYYIVSLNEQVNFYKKQQGEFSRIVTAPYLTDMDAARRAWLEANPHGYGALQYQGISVRADSIVTEDFTAVLDPRDPTMTSLSFSRSDVAPGEAVIYLGQYYDENNTKVPGWSAAYTVNRTTHAVSGITPTLVQNIAYQYYADGPARTIYQKLGVPNGTVTGHSSRLIDCSYFPESGNWMDVTEHRYALKNTAMKPYLLIKTYVNATTQKVAGIDVSRPYYDSVTGINY